MDTEITDWRSLPPSERTAARKPQFPNAQTLEIPLPPQPRLAGMVPLGEYANSNQESIPEAPPVRAGGAFFYLR